MTSVFSLPFLALFVYLFLLSPACLGQNGAPGKHFLASSSQPPAALAELENQLFFRDYKSENATTRLSRMENYIFGQTWNETIHGDQY